MYTIQVGLYMLEDAILCSVFPASLKGAALSWFTKLSQNLIDRFQTFTTKCEAQSATSRPHQLTSLALVNIRQNKNEPL